MIETNTVKPSPNDAVEFSLVQGGPLFQVLLRAGLVRPSMELLTRRMVVISAIAWLPLVVLTIISGDAFGGPGMPFIYDLGAHARLLICVPLLLAAEVIVHSRIRLTVRQFLDRGIVHPEDRPRFESLIASAMRLRNSVLAELITVALAVAAGPSVGPRYISTESTTWYAAPSVDGLHFSAAGWWYAFVSLMIFRFLLLRWYFRIFVWYRFLWQVSRRIPLQLNALHPDQAGGLAFLTGSVLALQPVLLAHTFALSGILGGKIWHEGATLPQFKLEIIAWLVFLMLLVLAPLFFFIPQLSRAKRLGLMEYGLVATRYVAEFRGKWIETSAPTSEAIIGTADIQSLADLSNSYQVVREMRMVPFSRNNLVQMAFWIALPLAPLTLTMIPLEQLIDRALGVVF